MNFEFATANRIIFANGAIQRIGGLASTMGSKALVVSGSRRESVLPLQGLLNKSRIHSVVFQVPTEPTIPMIQEGLSIARKAGVDLVIGFGGGSAIDAGKAIAALITNPGEVLDYLEVIGKGKKIDNPPLPYIAAPTTAGTGAEVTKNAVLLSDTDRVKVSLRHNWMLPRIALIDPELTYSMPPNVTAHSGLDALTQLIEPFVCNSPNPLTDGICREGLRRASRSLAKVYHSGDDPSAREDMAAASLFGGLALANAKLGAVHGIAGPLGGMINGPHGALCACLLPIVLETNVKALKSRSPQLPIMERFIELSRILTGRGKATIEDGLVWIHSICDDLNIPSLATYGLKPADIPRVAEQSQRASSMQGNPIILTVAEVIEILTAAM
jgi:alcohol dehydrogenase class IV